MSIPILRVIGGVLLILAGLFAYFGITLGLSAAVVFIIAGGVVILVSITGHRPRPFDVAIFVVGILVLSGVTVGYGQIYQGSQTLHYSATQNQISTNSMFVTVSASTGAVSVGYTSDPSTGYTVTFTRNFGAFTFIPPGETTVTNSTQGGVFYLNVTAGAWDVNIVLGSRYTLGMQVAAETGSVSLNAGGNHDLTRVSLTTSTGSVDATIDASSIQGLTMTTNTGSVTLNSNHLGAAGQRVPVSLSTNTGSVSMSVSLQANSAVTVSGSTGLGTLNHHLTGFTVSESSSTSVQASTGDMNTAGHSFVVSAQTDLGSVDMTLRVLSS